MKIRASIAVLFIAATMFGCKSTNSNKSSVLATDSTKEQMIDGKIAEDLMAALAKGDELDNSNEAAADWRATDQSSQFGYMLKRGNDSVKCEKRTDGTTVCWINLKSGWVKGDISRVLVSGKIALTPQPASVAPVMPPRITANTVTINDGTDNSSSNSGQKGTIMVEGTSTNWKLDDLRYVIHNDSNAGLIACGKKGFALNDTACLFALVSGTDTGSAAVDQDKQNGNTHSHVCRLRQDIALPSEPLYRGFQTTLTLITAANQISFEEAKITATAVGGPCEKVAKSGRVTSCFQDADGEFAIQLEKAAIEGKDGSRMRIVRAGNEYLFACRLLN